MKKIIKRVSIAIICVVFLAGSAWAIPYYPTNDDIAAWQFLSVTDNSGVAGGWPTVTGETGDATYVNIIDQRPTNDFILFSALFEFVSPQYEGGVAFGSTTAQNLTGFDNFTISLFNANENPWEYTLWVGNYDGSTTTTYNIGATSIVNQTSQILTLDLLDASSHGINLASAYIGFAVGNQTVPVMTNDIQSETRASAVPEPGTLLLLGSGLLGLCGLGYRRKRNKI